MNFNVFKLTFIQQAFSSLLSRKHILNQAGIMIVARVVGMVIGAIGSVWAARCLGPHNLGISGMVQNIVSQAALLLGVIYSTVLIREYKNAKTDEIRNQLIRVSNTFRLVGALVFCLIGGSLMAFHFIPSNYHFAGWFFIPLLLIGTIQPVWVFQAAEKQHFQSAIAILQPILTASLYLLLFHPGISAGADLAVISIVSAILTVIYWWAIYRLTSMKGKLLDLGIFRDAWKLILESRWLFISSIAIYVYTTFEQPLLGWLYSLEELGKYRTAVTVTNVAANFFSIIPMILYPRFIEWQKRGMDILWRRLIKLVVLFAVIGSFISILGFILIPFFYPIVFGPRFIGAAIPCAILVLSKIFATLGGIFYWGLITQSRHDKISSLITIGMAVFSLLFNLVCIPRWGMYGAASVDLTVEIIGLIVVIFVSRNRMRLITQTEENFVT